LKKELLILRHAKSDWNAKHTIDRDRPLNKRGRRDAQLMGDWMVQQKRMPDIVLCSLATRATSTLEYVLAEIGADDITVDYQESLYIAELTTLLEIISKIPESTQRLLIVGHNPGLKELVTYLSDRKIEKTGKGKIFTTANLAVLELPDGFGQLQKHAGKLISLIRPKELRLK